MMLCLASAFSEARAWKTETEGITDNTSYYLYNIEAGRFLRGGDAYGTQASLGTKGEYFIARKEGDLYKLIWSERPAMDGIYIVENQDRNQPSFLDRGIGKGNNLWKITSDDGNKTWKIQINPDDELYGTAKRKGITSFAWGGDWNITWVNPLRYQTDWACQGNMWLFLTSDEYEDVAEKVAAALEVRKAMYPDVCKARQMGLSTVLDELSAYDNPSTAADDLKAAQAGLATKLKAYVGELPQSVSTVDMSGWILNADMANNNRDYWTATLNEGTANGLTESFKRVFEFYQPLTGLPAGKYKVRVRARQLKVDAYSQGGALYAENNYSNTYSRNIGDALIQDGSNLVSEACTVFQEYVDGVTTSLIELDGVCVVDGTLKIGIKASDTGSWITWTGFRLEYDGAHSLSALQAELSAKQTAVKTALENKNIEWLKDNTVLQEECTAKYDGVTACANAYVALFDWDKLFDSGIVAQMEELLTLCTEQGTMADAVASCKENLKTVRTPADVQKVYNTLLDAYNKVAEGDVIRESFDFNDGNTSDWSGTPGTGNGVVEFYNKDFDFNRSLSGLPTGWYQVTVDGFYRTHRSSLAIHEARQEKNLSALFGDVAAGAFEVPIMCVYDEASAGGSDAGYPNWMSEANSAFNEKHLYHNVLNVWVADGNLSYGLRGRNQGESWICFDNFSLVYKGTDMAGLYAAMADYAKSAAAKVSKACLEEMVDYIDKSSSSDITLEAVNALNDKVKSIVLLANAEADMRISLVAKQNEYTDLVNKTMATDAEKGAYQDAITAAENAIETAITTPAEIQPYLDAIDEAGRTYKKAANPNEGETLDMTFLLTNPQVNGFNQGTRFLEGWYHDMPSVVNFMVQDNSGQRGETSWNKFQEFYDNRSLVPGWALYQKANVPVGAYRMRVAAFANDVTVAPVLHAGEVVGSPVSSTTLAYGTVDFLQMQAENDVKLGVKTMEGNRAQWIGANDMTLTKQHLVTLNGNQSNYLYMGTQRDFTGSVCLDRTIPALAWSTICLPFDLSAEQVSARFSRVYELQSAEKDERGVYTLTFAKPEGGIMKAGHPYLVWLEEAVDRMGFTGVTLQAGSDEPAPVDIDGVKMQGNYSSTSIVNGDGKNEQYYFFSGNKLWKADRETAVNGFRAYITVPVPADGAEVRGFIINMDDVATGMENVSASEQDTETVDVYTLSGIRVRSGVRKGEALDGLSKGVYVVNGKKVIK